MKDLPVFQSTPIEGSPALCWLDEVEPAEGVMQFGGGVEGGGTAKGQFSGAG
jgi:hypothetical protein